VGGKGVADTSASRAQTAAAQTGGGKSAGVLTSRDKREPMLESPAPAGCRIVPCVFPAHVHDKPTPGSPEVCPEPLSNDGVRLY